MDMWANAAVVISKGKPKKKWNKSSNSSTSSTRHSTWNYVRQDWWLQCEKTSCNRL